MEFFGTTTICIAIFIAAIIYIRYQFYLVRKQILLGLGVRDDRRKGRGPKLLKSAPEKRKPKVIDESKLIKKEGE